MNFIMNIVDFIGDICYTTFDILLLSGVFILCPFESVTDKLELHAVCLSKCNSWCKNKYNDICYEIGWKTCEFVTHMNHVHNKYILPNFHKLTSNYFKPCVFLVKDGEEIATFASWNEYENEKDEITFDYVYNMILYTSYNDDDDSKRNYTIIGDRHLKNPHELLKHKSNVSFIIFQLTTEEITYDICLKEPKNFFIKDNTLNYSFFKWYMKRIYDIELTECFSVNYMTSDMSIVNLHNPFFIKFNEDGVTSFSSGKPKEPVVIVDDNTEDNYRSKLHIDILNNEKIKSHYE